MAAELECDDATGKTVYFQVRSATGTIWNTGTLALEAYLTANVANYAILAAEQGTASGYYTAAMPAVAAGTYNVVAKERAGVSPAETDRTVAVGTVEWDGTAVVALTTRAATGDAMALTAAERGSTADKLLGRSLAGGADGGRTVQDALRAARNKVAFDVPAAGQFTVYAEDDVTVAWTGTYTASAGANPVTAIDPA